MKKQKRIITEAERQQQLKERQNKIIKSFGKGMTMLGENNYPMGTSATDPNAPWNEPSNPEFVSFELDPEFSNFAGVKTLDDLHIINFIVRVSRSGVHGTVHVTLDDLHSAYTNNKPLIVSFLREPEANMERIGELIEEYIYDYMDVLIDRIKWDEPDYPEYDREGSLMEDELDEVTDYVDDTYDVAGIEVNVSGGLLYFSAQEMSINLGNIQLSDEDMEKYGEKFKTYVVETLKLISGDIKKDQLKKVQSRERKIKNVDIGTTNPKLSENKKKK